MEKWKKLMAGLMVMVLACQVLVGCGKDNTSTGGTGNEESQPSSEVASVSDEGSSEEESLEESEEAPVSDEEIGTITVMGVDWGYGPKQNSTMEQWWEEYFGVDFDIEWVSYKDYPQKLNTLLASGKSEDLPDVIQIMSVNDSFYYPVFAQAIDAGVFVNLDSYLFDEGLVAGNEVMSEWSDQVWENTKYKGNTFILPRSVAEVAPNSGFTVRRDLMREFDMETEPTTMDEFKDWVIELADKAGIYALEFASADIASAAQVKAFATAFTGQESWGIDGDGNYVYQPFADGYIDFMDFMKDLYDAGAIDPEFIMEQTDVSKWRAGNSIGVLQAWYNWNQSEDRETNKIFDKNTPDSYETWCLLPLEGPKGTAVSLHAYGFGECIAINSNASDAKVRKILEVFNTTGEEYMHALMNGVEGLHFEYDENGAMISDEDQKTAKQEGYVGAWNQIFLKANLDIIEQKFMQAGAKRASDEAIERAYEIKEATEKAVSEMDLKPVTLNLISETYNNSWGTLIADCNDMIAMYIMGEMDLDAWNSYAEGIVSSSEYEAINNEFKTAAAEAGR